MNNSLLGPVYGSYALAQHEMALCPSLGLGLQLMQQALWRGDWNALQHYGMQDCPLTCQACSWNSVGLDEAQAIKNAQTKRAQAVMDLQSNFRVVATGTPLENHLGELWSLFRFITPGLLGSQESFATSIEQGDVAARRALKA
ncbi:MULTISPECIES: SNF2-related protein [unclassified Pseudomonas]|uniref:SNF2-related protein n=1 Tax=unclassified Pseudomonas TaxID=196821 RepID=UPI001EE1E6A8|nr:MULTISPECIES: SNF2-related protein [unclassified Pseudomonas]